MIRYCFLVGIFFLTSVFAQADVVVFGKQFGEIYVFFSQKGTQGA